jgi:hypothetical protein
MEWKMKQITAVEWLQDELIKNNPSLIYKSNLFEQAKELEKQQIKDAYNSDQPNLSCIEDGSASEKYYNETYGGKQ